MIWIAQLTDTHLNGGESGARFERIAAWLERFTPPVDAIVLTGDLVEVGELGDGAEVYTAMAERLASIAPAIAVPGNCDDPEALAAAFLVPGFGVAPLGANTVLVVGDAVAVIGLDSSIPGQFEGRLSAETLGWLETVLAALPAGMSVILAMHHPPVALGHPAVDGFRLENPDSLAAVVRKEPRIVGILVGHTHGATVAAFAGKPVIVGPGIHSAMTLPQEPPTTPPSLIDFAVQPGVALHRIDGDTITTHFRSVAG